MLQVRFVAFVLISFIAVQARSPEQVVATTPPAVETRSPNVSGYLQAQRSGEFGDEKPSKPSSVPPYPQQPGSNVPVRPEFENPAQNGNPTTPTERSLSGVWSTPFQVFKGTPKGCDLGYSGHLRIGGRKIVNPGTTLIEGTTVITQEGNQLKAPDVSVSVSDDGSFSDSTPPYTQSFQGTVSGNQFRWISSGEDFVNEYTGTISDDGNRITGKVVCRYSNLPRTATASFTWTRKN